MDNSEQHHKKPSAKQLRYLRDLAEKTGRSFAYPTTSAEAGREIDRLRGAARTSPDDLRREKRAIQRDMAERRGDAARIDLDVELEGYGSQARWSTQA